MANLGSIKSGVMSLVGDVYTNTTMMRLFDSLCALQTPDEAEAFLHDILTPHEVTELAQRLEVANLLHKGYSYQGVSRVTGASSTTVSRVSKCLNGEVGGYRLILDRIDTE